VCSGGFSLFSLEGPGGEDWFGSPEAITALRSDFLTASLPP
jgi:hypothetical protein